MGSPRDLSSLASVQAELSRMSLARPKAAVSEPLPPKRVKALLQQGKAIYGSDSRVETSDSSIPSYITRAVCVLFERSRLQAGPGGYALRTESFGAKYKLCSGQRFRDQPLLGYGSGFLVAPDVLATAGHCVDGLDVKTICVLFDFEVRGGDVALTRKAEDVYFAAEVLASTVAPDGADYALVRLDRKVSGVKPLSIRSNDVELNDRVYVIGHPVGLPKKAATGAEVLDNKPKTYFLANLDTFGGNSGSPVLTQDNKVCGILVRGEQDFVQQGDCYVATTFPLNMAGEAVCRASVWGKLVAKDKLSKLSDVSTARPPRRSDHVEGRQALAEFLSSAFTGGELRRLVRYNLILEPLSDSINWEKSLADVVEQMIAGLERHDLIGGDFFSILKSERPMRTTEVDAIRKAYSPTKRAGPRSTRTGSTAKATGRGTGGGGRMQGRGGSGGSGGPSGPGGNGDGGPDRRAVYDALVGLSPEDFATLVEIDLDREARLAVGNIEGQARIARALIAHYDVEYRGLGQLHRLIQQRLRRP